MGQTAIISPQIIDSTSIGRDLITSVDAAAGRTVLEIEDASYNWAGDHVFEGSIEATNYAFTAGQDGQLSHPDLGNSIYVRFNNADVYRFNALDFWPVSTGTKNLGRSDHEWANVYSVDGTFSGVVKPAGGLDIDSGQMHIKHQGNFRLGIGGAGIFMYEDILPNYDNITNGTSTKRWGNTYSIDGSFSGNLSTEVGGSQRVYNLGTDGDTDTEYLETSFISNIATISTEATGSGAKRNLYFGDSTVPEARITAQRISIVDGGAFAAVFDSGYASFYQSGIRPQTSGVQVNGTAANRWGNVYSVDGDFSGTVTADAIQHSTGTGSIALTNDGGSLKRFSDVALQWGFNSIILKGNVEQWNGGAGNFDIGTNSNPWNTGYFIDGSFSGNLVSEVGGSQRVYNLGTEGDADTEALVVSADGTTYDIFSTITGTGAHRRIDIGGFVGSAYRGLRLDTANGILDWQYNNATKFKIDSSTAKISSTTTITNDIRPDVTDVSDNGTTSFRWANVASVDGDFSGNVIMAANVDFTGLPTADPVVAGRLWNDSGTLKISAG